MKLIVIFAIIGIATCGALPKVAKDALMGGVNGMVDIAMKCLKEEANAKAKTFIKPPLDAKKFIDNIDKIVTPKIKDGIKSLLTPLRRRLIGFSMPAIPGIPTLSLDLLKKIPGVGELYDATKAAKDISGALTGKVGAALKEAVKKSVCTSIVALVKTAAASAGILYLPTCVTKPVYDACASAIDKAMKRRQILRRLAAIQREIKNF